jgi:TonB-dependent receptor
MCRQLRLFGTIVAAIVVMTAGQAAYAAANGTITGSVRDAQTGEGLPGANVTLVGTGFGASSDIYGKFLVRNVPAGSYKVRTAYIGYKTVEATIQVRDGADTKHEVKLDPVSVEGEAVIVTAQAEGQNEAINQQLMSAQIVNVVSAARIQELPDANAAETIGRLPGVSILRSGGEGNQIVIRGLQPKYNAVMIDGVRMSSSNPNDRSVDLSMISPNMLDGIEVSKSVTADQDGDVLGGTVNFKMREAHMSDNPEAGLAYDFLAQGGYNALSNAYHKINNYKYVGSVEGRFFDQKLGVFAQADLERRNLTSNEFGGTYTYATGGDHEHYTISNVNLNNIPRDRTRANGTLVLDYRLPDGKISFTNFFSTGTTTGENRGESYDIVGNNHDYSFAYTKSTLNKITNAINLEQQLDIFHVDAKVSHTYSETKDPNDYTISFRQSAADPINRFSGVWNVDPHLIPAGIPNDPARTFLSNIVTNSSFFKERAITASADVDWHLNISDLITSVFKVGGKYRYQERTFDNDQYDGQGLSLASGRFVDDLITSHFSGAAPYAGSTTIPITAFKDPNYDYGKFLDGDFIMYSPVDASVMGGMAKLLQDNYEKISAASAIAYGHDDFQSTSHDYSGHEALTAFYAMGTFNVGPDITIIPGVRYQNLTTTYTAARGQESPLSFLSYAHNDTTFTVSHPFTLPDVSIRIKPLSWLDIRLSYSTTIAYADYNAIIPRIDVANGSIDWNNYNLEPSKSQNYDANVSFYDNSFGLFTVGVFAKEIDNLIYSYSLYATGDKVWSYYPAQFIDSTSVPSGAYKINTYVNDPYRIKVSGVELDWQTHFWYLPDPFKGLVLNANYTHTTSKGEYPFTTSIRAGRTITYVDTSFTDRLLYQPNDIVNLSLGYDYKDFSVRVSMLYQADIFASVTYWEQNRTTTAPYRRWDMSIKQNLPWYGMQLFANLNNINNARDINVLQMYSNIPQSAQSYGMTADVGVRVKL